MSSLTLKNIPEPLLERLRQRAAEQRRSLNQEVLFLLEKALRQAPAEERASWQVEVWSRLAGEWESELSVKEEVESLLAARSAGRPVDF